MAADGRNDQGLIDAALAIAYEREESTRRLARAVLEGDYETARRLARELLPNEAQRRSLTDLYYTDKEFCSAFKINRSTSAGWRELGIVGYLKLPNGQIRYSREHVEALTRHGEKPKKSD